MRRITLWGLSTLTALVLLFGYHTSTGATGTTLSAAAVNGAVDDGPDDAGSTAAPDGSATDPGTSADDGAEAGSDDGSSTGSTGDDTTTASATTVTGDAASTRYGPVQVEITVEDGRITSSAVTQVPWSDGRDRQINSYAVPLLNASAVRAQSADVDMVSGATYTSQGYAASLQSAIDRANL